MADNMTGRAERPDFHDNDPFAELTRIMGHDPRQDAAGQDEADLALDLENELLGDLDLRSEEETEAVAAPEAQWDALPEPEWEDLPQEGPGNWHAAEAPAEEIAAPDTSAEPAFEESVDLDFSDLDAELGAAFENGLENEEALPEDSEPAFAVKPSEAGADWADTGQESALAPETSELPSAEEAASDWRSEDWHPSVEEVPVGEPEELRPEPDTATRDWEIGEGSADQPAVFRAEQEPEATSGADEAMSGTDDAALDGFEFDDELLKALHEEPATGESEPAPFDDISASADEAPALEEVAAAPAIEPAPAVSSIPDAPKQLSLEEELTMLLAGADRPRAEPAAAFAAGAAPRPAEPVAEAVAAPVARPIWPSRTTPSAEREIPEIETVEMSGFEPIRSAEFEVPDLPVEEPVQASSEFDDITAEFSRAFEASETTERATEEDSFDRGFAAQDQAAAPQPDFDWDSVADAPQSAAYHSGDQNAAEQDYFDEASFRGGFEETDEAAGRSAYGHDDDLDGVMAANRPVLRDNRRRNMMVAGGALALVLLGGVGVFALWSGGGSSGEPVLLQADGEPVRVRPEEPGGTVVPNQDSEVYQRVAGGREEAEPSQARLIDTAEEPIDLTVQNAPRIVGTGADGDAGFGSDLSAVKVEERLESGLDETAANASDDMVALQPRRVRTMVVRPDGSIVPREDPAPAAAPSTEGQSAAPQSLAPASDAPAEAAQPPAATPESAAEAATDMPEEIALAPATRPTPEQQPAATPAPAPAPTQAPQPEPQVAAVSPTPAVPQATQTSEWSMQIASQPSSESAQTTYQDLARRYSSLLEGRGVNIVRAEVDGRTFYRVRIPMATRDEAVNLCTRYQQAGGSCFVSR